jgi:hypothetical protein
VGQRATAVAVALDAGAGAAIPQSSRNEAVVEGHAIVTEPGIAVRFFDIDAARIGRPSILGTITVAGWI